MCEQLIGQSKIPYVVTFLNAKASGHLVAKTIKSKMYLLPALVLFNGPSTSKAILVKGSFITGSWFKVAAFATMAGPAFWQIEGDAQRSLTS